MPAHPESLSPPIPRWLARMLALSCVVITGLILIHSLAPPQAVAPLPNRDSGTVNTDRLKSLFGAESESAITADSPAQTGDPSVRLHGLIVDPSGSVALISLNEGPPRAYSIGTTLPGSMKILAIEDEQVILGRSNGQRVVLKIPPRPAPKAPPSQPAARR